VSGRLNLRQLPERPPDAHPLAHFAGTEVEETSGGMKFIHVGEELAIALSVDAVRQVGQVTTDEPPDAALGGEQATNLNDELRRGELRVIVAVGGMSCLRLLRALTLREGHPDALEPTDGS
jgi:hypothetical protein